MIHKPDAVSVSKEWILYKDALSQCHKAQKQLAVFQNAVGTFNANVKR